MTPRSASRVPLSPSGHLGGLLEIFLSLWLVLRLLPLSTSHIRPLVSIFAANTLPQVTFISEKPKRSLLGLPRSRRLHLMPSLLDSIRSPVLKALEHSQPGQDHSRVSSQPPSGSAVPPGVTPGHLVRQDQHLSCWTLGRPQVSGEEEPGPLWGVQGAEAVATFIQCYRFQYCS